MAAFRQTALKPARYKFSGVQKQLTGEELGLYVAGTRKLIAAGYRPPLLLEHAAPGSSEGQPRQFSVFTATLSEREKKALELENSRGYLADIFQDADGALGYELEVTDPQTAEQFANGSLKFTSPELRPLWQDGVGGLYPFTLGHVAVTHRPRNPNQSDILKLGEGSFAGPVQFSLADMEDDMAFDDEERDDDAASKNTDDTPVESKGDADPPKQPEPPAEPENPDMPQTNLQEMQQFEALLAHLTEHGFALPAGTTMENLVERLLTALMTASAAKQKADEQAAAKQDRDGGDLKGAIEETPPAMLFSVDDVAKLPAAVAELVTLKAQLAADKLKGLVNRRAITPHAYELLTSGKAMQFSADGKFAKTFDLADLAEIFEEAFPDDAMFPARQFSLDALPGTAEDQHPKGEAFFQPPKKPGEDIDDARADEIAEAQTARFNQPIGV
jgi:hypothetical protein